MSRTVEIGSLRERVDILDEPDRNRVGWIRHRNGENVAVDHATLLRLMDRARTAREDSPGTQPPGWLAA